MQYFQLLFILTSAPHARVSGSSNMTTANDWEDWDWIPLWQEDISENNCQYHPTHRGLDRLSNDNSLQPHFSDGSNEGDRERVLQSHGDIKPEEIVVFIDAGSDSNLQPIFTDGHVVQVGENLASALQHLRNEDARRGLWADALCINQSNIEERNHQVSRMGSIFQKAKSVQAWLGAASDDSGEAIALMMDINNCDWRDNFLKDLADGGDAILQNA